MQGEHRERAPWLELQRRRPPGVHDGELRCRRSRPARRLEAGERRAAEREQRAEQVVEPVAGATEHGEMRRRRRTAHRRASASSVSVTSLSVGLLVDLHLVRVGPHPAGGADAVEVADEHVGRSPAATAWSSPLSAAMTTHVGARGRDGPGRQLRLLR